MASQLIAETAACLPKCFSAADSCNAEPGGEDPAGMESYDDMKRNVIPEMAMVGALPSGFFGLLGVACFTKVLATETSFVIGAMLFTVPTMAAGSTKKECGERFPRIGSIYFIMLIHFYCGLQ